MSDQPQNFNQSLDALKSAHGKPIPMTPAKSDLTVVRDMQRTAKIVVVNAQGQEVIYAYDISKEADPSKCYPISLKDFTPEEADKLLRSIAPEDPMLSELKKYFHQGGFRSSAKNAIGSFDPLVAFQEASRDKMTETFTFNCLPDGSVQFKESYEIGLMTFPPDASKLVDVNTVLVQKDPVKVKGAVSCTSILSLNSDNQLQQKSGAITLKSDSPELSTQFKKMLPNKPTINPKEWEEAEAYFKANVEARSFKSTTTPAHDFVKVGGLNASIYVHPNANEISQDHEFELAGFSAVKLAFSKNINAKPDVVGTNKEGVPEKVTYGTLASAPEFFGPNHKTQFDDLQKDLKANYKAENINFLKLLHDLKATGPDFNPKNKEQARLLADLKKYIPVGSPQQVNISADLQKKTQEAIQKRIGTFGKKVVNGGIADLLKDLDDAKAEVVVITSTNAPTKNNAAVPVQNYLKPVGPAPKLQEKIEVPAEPVKQPAATQQPKAAVPSKASKSNENEEKAATISRSSLNTSSPKATTPSLFETIKNYFKTKPPVSQQPAAPAPPAGLQRSVSSPNLSRTAESKPAAAAPAAQKRHSVSGYNPRQKDKLSSMLGASPVEMGIAQSRESPTLSQSISEVQRKKLEKLFGEDFKTVAPASPSSTKSASDTPTAAPPPLVLSGGPAAKAAAETRKRSDSAPIPPPDSTPTPGRRNSMK